MSVESTPDRLTTRDLLVVGVRLEAEGVISVHLEAPPGEPPLAAWKPGAHLELRLPGGITRQYSLFGDPEDRSRYTIAVLREPESRGGSAHLHDTGLVGGLIAVRGPRNKFELVGAPTYVFVAGGIGITPITAMAREATRRGAEWTLHYGGRSRRNMALVDKLEQFARPGQVDLMPQDERGMLDLPEIVRSLSSDALLYACGPEPMLRALEEEAKRQGKDTSLHIERFGPVAPATAIAREEPDPLQQTPFEVRLERTGITVTVPPEKSVLDIVREQVPNAPASCEEGFCGSCEVRVLSGVPDHRDDVLSAQEKEENETMMLCVSRSLTDHLVIDL